MAKKQSRVGKVVEKARAEQSERASLFHDEFKEDLRYWIATDKKIASRVMEIVMDVLRDPFKGIGKPEPLRFEGPDVWSRRLTDEHRVVYVVKHTRIDFLTCRYHY